jgi:hypothetical protein
MTLSQWAIRVCKIILAAAAITAAILGAWPWVIITILGYAIAANIGRLHDEQQRLETMLRHPSTGLIRHDHYTCEHCRGNQ